jgi:hypothetical protein
MEQGRAAREHPVVFGRHPIEKVNEFFPPETMRRYFDFLSQIDSLLAKLLKTRSARLQASQTRSTHRVECQLARFRGDLGDDRNSSHARTLTSHLDRRSWASLARSVSFS